MLEQLTVEDFAPHLQTPFYLELDGEDELELRLIEAVPAGGTSSHRDPFSVLFLGPAEPLLPQAIYNLRHERMGSLGLFLVPLGPFQEGIQYESVFT